MRRVNHGRPGEDAPAPTALPSGPTCTQPGSAGPIAGEQDATTDAGCNGKDEEESAGFLDGEVEDEEHDDQHGENAGNDSVVHAGSFTGAPSPDHAM